MSLRIYTREEVSEYIGMLPKINADADNLKRMWPEFFFGWISPFKCLNVSVEDFEFFYSLYPEGDFHSDDIDKRLHIPESNGKAFIVIITEIKN